MEKFQYCLSYSCDTFSHPLRVTHARKLTEILLSWWGKRSFWNITVVSMTIYLYHVVPHFRETQNKFFLGCSTLQEKKSFHIIREIFSWKENVAFSLCSLFIFPAWIVNRGWEINEKFVGKCDFTKNFPLSENIQILICKIFPSYLPTFWANQHHDIYKSFSGIYIISCF